jgi:multidrug resistance protein
VPQILATFRPAGHDKALGSFCVTVYVLGFSVGPLLLGPLADVYGRAVVYRASMLAYLALTVGCALAPSLEALIALRFFAGCFGGAPMAIGGAVVTDLYAADRREKALAWYSVGSIMAPTFGPALGGVITGRLGWRWVFWLSALLVCISSPRRVQYWGLTMCYSPGRRRRIGPILRPARNTRAYPRTTRTTAAPERVAVPDFDG